jgi:hypothetical protein
LFQICSLEIRKQLYLFITDGGNTMNTTSQESDKQGDGRSTTGTGAKMSPQSGQSGLTGSQGGSMGSQTGAAGTHAGATGTQSGSTGSFGSQTGSTGSIGSQTGSRETQTGSAGIHAGSQTGTQRGREDRVQNWGSGGSEAQQHAEGPIARTIEQQTAKLPSDLFLWAAAASIGVSAVFEFTGNKDKSRFIGQWVAPFLLLGVYNKLVKTQGSDRTNNTQSGNFNRSSSQGFAG